MIPFRTVVWLSSSLLLLAGCGDVVVERPSSGTTGSGTTGSGTTGSGGSSAASTSSSSSSSAGSGGGGGGALFCGGFAGIPCPADQFCDYLNGLCGGDDDGGVCTPKPMGCLPDCPGVCGCDGAFYCNECGAQMAGVDLSTSTSCPSMFGAYSAYLWYGGLDHLVVRKADPSRDVCVRLYLNAPGPQTSEYAFSAPQQFVVSHATISHRAADCDTMAPAGEEALALGGQGTLTWQLSADHPYPCEIDVRGSVSFEPSAPWMRPVERIEASGIAVEGGCL